MRPLRSAVFLLALTAFAAAPAPGQLSLSLEVLPGLAVPSGEFTSIDNGIEATPGPSIGIGGAVGLGVLSAYGEYQYARFGCGECQSGGLDDAALDAGWEAGVQLQLPLPFLPVTPWVRGGAVGHRLQLSGDQGTATSAQGVGFGAGAGVYLGMPGPLQLAPSVRVRSYTADFDFENSSSRSTRVSAAVLSLGLAYRF